MSWRGYRLSTLVVLVLLYTAPLSSGDKGLWLSLISMPDQLLRVIPDGTPPEHEILPPDDGTSGLATFRTVIVEDDFRYSPAVAETAITSIPLVSWRRSHDARANAAPGELARALAVPRGPPA